MLEQEPQNYAFFTEFNTLPYKSTDMMIFLGAAAST
jgi:hypothetical protein